MSNQHANDRELEFLFQLSRTLAHRLPLRQMLHIILDQLVFILELDEGLLVVTLPHQQGIILGTKRKTLPVLERQLFSHVMETHQPLAITNTHKPQESGDIPTHAIQSPSRALLVLPLYVREQSLGVLFVYRKQPLPFEYSNFIFFNEVASRLADYIENNRLIEEITQKEQQLAAVIEHSGEGIAVLDETKHIIIWNAALERLTRVKSEDVIGQPCTAVHNLFWGEDCPFESAQSFGEYTLEPSHGRIRQYVSVMSSTVNLTTGKAHRVFLFRDISKAKELDEAKSDFISLATHQLRTPLTAILGYLSMLLAKDVGSLNRVQRRYLEQIRGAAHRLSSLVEDLLHVIRLEEGRLSFATEPVSIRHLVDDILPDLTDAARYKSLHFIVKDANDIAVLADSKWTKHALVNLIDNAIKYTPPDGTITVSWEGSRAQGKSVGVVHVQDTGVGIARGDQELIFQKFGRLQGNPINVSGSGLGLYIAKQLVEKQGGSITVRSVRGKGSTFSLAFPLSVGSEARTPRSPASYSRHRGNGEHGGEHRVVASSKPKRRSKA